MKCSPLSTLTCVLLVLGVTASVAATPTAFIPTNDAVILARFPAASRQAGGRPARGASAACATNLPLALATARDAIRRARAEADPRILGLAQLALAPWLSHDLPPVDALVLRGTVRQSLHDFDGALQDLDAALSRAPRHESALLTKATIHVVRGEVPAARTAAARLLTLVEPLTATVIIAQIAELDGHGESAVRTLGSALSRQEPKPNDVPADRLETVVWATTTLAEMLDRRGRPSEAEHHFKAALGMAPTDPYLLGAYGDFLLDQRRPAEVLALLEGHERIDSLLLRMAEAQRAFKPGSESAVIERLGERFDLARARGDRLHLREEARFHLRLRADRVTAHRLALENWAIQKEPADRRLMMESEPVSQQP